MTDAYNIIIIFIILNNNFYLLNLLQDNNKKCLIKYNKIWFLGILSFLII